MRGHRTMGALPPGVQSVQARAQQHDYHHERRGGEPLRKLLRKHQADCFECQSYKAKAVVKAVKGLLNDLAEMPAVVGVKP